MPDVVVTEFIEESALADLSRDFSVVYDPELVKRPDDIKLLAAEAPALIVRNMTQVRGDVLAACQSLRIIGRLGVGLDNIDMEACRARGIQVFPATGANAQAVAEYVIAAIFMGLRNIWGVTDKMAAGWFDRTTLIFREVHGKMLGLIGFGDIARQVAQRARALGMRVAAYDPNVLPGDPAWTSLGVAHLDLVPLLADSDVVSLHVPLLPSTRNLVDAAALALMKPDAILINTARGGIVDESALVTALKAKRLGGAILDVLEKEPPAANSIFRGVPNLILTPHVAGNTVESNVRVSGMTVANVKRALKALAKT
ncbi:MAG TPA: hydroxyacid dehydrogenase [Alphaproteobacteria bacterium]